MSFLTTVFTQEEINYFESWVNEGFFLLAMGLFVLEMVRYAFKRKLTLSMLGDSVSNFITLFAFIVITSLIAAVFYVATFVYVFENFSIVQIPITGWSILACLILADLAYYWEHRFAHSVNIAWASHTVHHSSPYFNISVAYRFGPLDGLFPLFFYLPLAMLGFDPFLIFFCEVVVQVYQTLLHTESVKKLPRPIEWIMNTPSHHRVHHATNREYLDKNYAGILIIWDRMFGTFAEEKATVRYGVFPRIKSFNPIIIFCHGYVKLTQQIWRADGWKERWQLLIKPSWMAVGA
ncbi:sterol desaturase family protein [Microbulbifer sp. JMSA002]|uniref:sterol desaturase family protein n=1 Tax=Microbulbifer sp. JMSA002 TaxID=3243368 RepID=UPI00403A3568